MAVTNDKSDRFDFDHKIIIVTGGARGIGLAVVRYLLKSRAAVALCDINAHELEKTHRSLQEEFPDAVLFSSAVDVSKFKSVLEFVQTAEHQIATALESGRKGAIDGCVNCAGVLGDPKSLVSTTDDDWDLIIDTNLKGVFNSLKAQIPLMRPGGSIVNVASVGGLVGFPSLSPYSASKFGVIGLTKSVAKEVAMSGLRVNAVCPGFTDTMMIKEMSEKEGEPGIPMPEVSEQLFSRHARPEEIAEFIGFLLSDKSKFITGAALPIEGGWTA